MSSTSEHDGDGSVACFEEFAFCFSFLKKFREDLSLPSVTLLSLERFLCRDILNPDDPLTALHHQMVSSITRRPVSADNWCHVLTRLAYTASVIDDMDMEYEEFSVKERLKLLKFLCELQFDRNQSFKHHLAKIPDNDPLWRDDPIGLDKEGRRYWLLQDDEFDLRVYSEFKYLEYPFDHPQWNLLCRSLDQLLKLVDKLSTPVHSIVEKEEETIPQEEPPTIGPIGTNSTRKKKSNRNKTVIPKENAKIGCMVCGKDTLYSKMLLCDGCDKECHTFCQYPILWEIPDVEWFCPTCRQLKLIDRLKTVHENLTQSKVLYEQSIEDRRRKVKRLARGGVLVGNIIEEQQELEEDEAPRRSGRSRKRLDYAELNELNIKLLQGRPEGMVSTRSRPPPPATRHARYERRNQLTMGLVHEVATPEEEVSCSRVRGFERITNKSVTTHDQAQSLICSYPRNVIKPTSSSVQAPPTLIDPLLDLPLTESYTTTQLLKPVSPLRTSSTLVSDRTTPTLPHPSNSSDETHAICQKLIPLNSHHDGMDRELIHDIGCVEDNCFQSSLIKQYEQQNTL